MFLAAIINFLVIGFCLFLIIRAFEKAQRKFIRSGEAAAVAEAAPPDPAMLAQERLTNALEKLTNALESRQVRSSCWLYFSLLPMAAFHKCPKAKNC